MSTDAKDSTSRLPATPWGLMPPRMRVLYVASARRAGAWLAEAFASDSACQVTMDEASGAAEGLALLGDRAYDAVLLSHDPPDLDALQLLEGWRAGGAEEPLVVLGQASEQEMAAQCFEVGADGYVCVNHSTTRMLLWIVARATERRRLLAEHRRLSQAEQRRLRQDEQEARQIIAEQRKMLREDGAGDTGAAGGSNAGHGAPLGEAIVSHYRELLRAQVMMGAGNLSAEMATLAGMLADADISAPQAMQLHLQAMEELVRGLGNRSARHVMTRADLLALEMLSQLAECYRRRAKVAKEPRRA